jgi:hypothetical protein
MNIVTLATYEGGLKYQEVTLLKEKKVLTLKIVRLGAGNFSLLYNKQNKLYTHTHGCKSVITISLKQLNI